MAKSVKALVIVIAVCGAIVACQALTSGPLTTLSHQTTGYVTVPDPNGHTIQISNFVTDDTAPYAYFFAGTTAPRPGIARLRQDFSGNNFFSTSRSAQDGDGYRYLRYDAQGSPVRNSTATSNFQLTLPSDLTAGNVKWLLLFCTNFNQRLAQLPRYRQPKN